MSFDERFGIVYETKYGQELFVAYGPLNKPVPSICRSYPAVLVLYSEQECRDLMGHWNGKSDCEWSERNLNGRYRVVKLKPIFGVVGWDIPNEMD